uniref:Uncharacterized protein n=1 Tax=Burkholderia phage vB_BgluM-SURPRISE13 TaxID=3159457 RepID=A0AAU7PGR5_9VIRU
MSEQFKLPAKIQSLSDRIFTQLDGKVDEKGNFDEEVQKTVFRTVATEDGRNVDQMIDDDNYRSDFIAGITHAAGRAAEGAMKKHKTLGTASGSFEIGRGSLDISFERHSRVPNRVLDKESGNFKVDGEKDVYGSSTVKYATYGAKNSRGDLAKVREAINQSFTSAFGS